MDIRVASSGKNKDGLFNLTDVPNSSDFLVPTSLRTKIAMNKEFYLPLYLTSTAETA